MKKIYSLFAALVVTSAVNAQTTLNYVFGSQGFSNGDEITTGSINANLNYSAAQNSSASAPAYYTSGSSFRMYAGNGDGNSYTITAVAGTSLNSLTINALSSYTPAVQYSVNGGAYQTATLAGTTYTITGLNAASSVKFRNAVTGSNTQLRISSLAINYTTGSLAVADFNKSATNFVKNTSVNNEIYFGSKAEVKVYSMNGQILKTASVSESKSLNVADLQNGIYIVTGLVEGKNVSQKIIKN